MDGARGSLGGWGWRETLAGAARKAQTAPSLHTPTAEALGPRIFTIFFGNECGRTWRATSLFFDSI